MAKYEISAEVIERDGPFREFKQNGAIVTVELASGRNVGQVLLVYPNEVWAVEGADEIPFQPADVVRVFQTDKDLVTKSSSDWVFFGAPNET